MTTLPKTIIAVTLSLAAGVAVYQTRQAAHLRAQLKSLQPNPMGQHLAETSGETLEASTTNTHAAEVAELMAKLRALESEVIRLRAQATRAAVERAEADQMRAALGALSVGPSNSNGVPVWIVNAEDGFFMEIRPETNLFARALNARISAHEKLRVAEDVERLTRKLGLSPTQAEAIQQLRLKAIEERRQPKSVGAIEALAALQNTALQQEEALKALLSPEQQRAWEELQQQDRLAEARLSAARELNWIQSLLGLPSDRQEQVWAVLVEHYKAHRSDSLNPLKGPDERLAERLRPLEAVLTPAEIEAYKKALKRR